MNPLEMAEANLVRTKDRMLELLAATPDDRLNWRPSPSARSIIEVVAHSAMALRNIATQMRGTAFVTPTSAEANRQFREHDAQFTSREEVAAKLEAECAFFVECLRAMTPSDLERQVAMPFGLGNAPAAVFVNAGANHTQGHIGQIEYIQTLYGDQDWHTGF